MYTVNDLKNALSGDKTEIQAVTAAQEELAQAQDLLTAAQETLQAAIDSGATDTSTEEQDVADAQAEVDSAQANLDSANQNSSTASTEKIVEQLKITDYGMVSNDMARQILNMQGKEVKFEEPEDIGGTFFYYGKK